MRGLIKNRLGRVGGDQKGFTLIEMLVVVGIIVALAAVIVPLVITFTGKGEEGKLTAEQEVVQLSIDAMMVDKAVTAITAVTALTNIDTRGAGVTEFLPAAGTNLDKYLREEWTDFCYTWAADGKITAQATPTTPGTSTTAPVC